MTLAARLWYFTCYNGIYFPIRRSLYYRTTLERAQRVSHSTANDINPMTIILIEEIAGYLHHTREEAFSTRLFRNRDSFGRR